MKQEESGIIKTYFLKILIVLGFLVALAIVYPIGHQYLKGKANTREIDNLRQEASRIENENSSIKDKIAYFETYEFQKKEAKDKLNLQSPDEKLVIVKPGLQTQAQPEVSDTAENSKPPVPNWRKWWNYLFKY